MTDCTNNTIQKVYIVRRKEIYTIHNARSQHSHAPGYEPVSSSISGTFSAQAYPYIPVHLLHSHPPLIRISLFSQPEPTRSHKIRGLGLVLQGPALALGPGLASALVLALGLASVLALALALAPGLGPGLVLGLVLGLDTGQGPAPVLVPGTGPGQELGPAPARVLELQQVPLLLLLTLVLMSRTGGGSCDGSPGPQLGPTSCSCNDDVGIDCAPRAVRPRRHGRCREPLLVMLFPARVHFACGLVCKFLAHALRDRDESRGLTQSA